MELSPTAKIVIDHPRPSDFSNYDTVPVTIRDRGETKIIDFLLSKDRRKLLAVSTFDLSQDPYQLVMKKIDLSGRPTKGAKDAKVDLVVYDDFECPFCARMYPVI